MQITEKVLLIALKLPADDSHRVKENLDELAFLCLTAGAEVCGRFTQSLPHPDNRTFVGKGKLQEILDFIKDHETDIVVFDDELSPLQYKNLEKQIPCRVLDRTNLILDIFASRAQTAQAKTQASPTTLPCHRFWSCCTVNTVLFMVFWHSFTQIPSACSKKFHSSVLKSGHAQQPHHTC